MSIAQELAFSPTSELKLDPRNPRLRVQQNERTQDELLVEMQDWGLEEIAASIIESGFWPQEALIVVDEKLTKKAPETSTIVIEGNRRLAAVKLLLDAWNGSPASPKWGELAKGLSSGKAKQLEKLPTIQAGAREDVDSFLGFRHVTGIKQWEPHEKAAFIAKLVDSGISYQDVMRRIGSKTQPVRQNYVAYKLFKQLEELDEVDAEKIRNKFSVLYLSLRSPGTQEFLGIDVDSVKEKTERPLKSPRRKAAIDFARWLFGDHNSDPLISDSRDADRFGKILGSKAAVAYLERSDSPRFEVALRLAGGDIDEAVRHIQRAADEIEEVLRTVQHHVKSNDVVEAAKRLFQDFAAFSKFFPKLLDLLKD